MKSAESLRDPLPGLGVRAVPYLPLALFAGLGALLAYLWKWPCRFNAAWNDGTLQFTNFCYTDIYPLWWNEHLNEGKVPYFDYPVEYPVGIGGIMEFFRRIIPGDPGSLEAGTAFYDLTVILMAVCLVVGVLMTAALAGPARRWDALWYALAPALVLTAYINWDLAANALALGALLAWSKRRQWLAGILLGLAIATKFYPLMFLGPLFLLAWRTGRWKPFLQTLGGTAGAWLAVNVPIMVFAFDGWKRFYVFSQERPADWGSLWYFFNQKGWPVLGDAERLDTLGVLSLGAFCVGIAVLTMTARNRPRLAQLCFLTLAAFMLTNKVWSPQYVLWLIPFAVLARPNWKPIALWMAAECWYFFAIWLYLVGLQEGNAHLGISGDTYFTAVWGRAATILIMMAFVVRDILRPDKDLVRQDGADDRAGGVFDEAPDRFRIALT
ncbi:glycosyltransferase family 87 protein [Planomonospora venezuelensis]|uniref:Putative membrane protein n=1 Tax=Planomonospora venezuelensis TaxID=1999 RepID=A0A841D865_PLAVE|nr:glycosyltransferase 87 family protein [Planomonospora venezuelensis]MBB5966822.1 putative membrane protein [Planomonospora venezuelensis]GIN01674.1 membrane protein [Planomonospora venezuelensis]